jgi:glutaredoxin
VSHVLAALLLLAAVGGPPSTAGEPAAPPVLELFTRAGCPRCAAARVGLAQLRAERPDLRVLVREVDRDPAARARLEQLSGRAGIAAPGVPSIYLRGRLVVGYRDADTLAALRALLAGGTPADAPLEGDACAAESAAACSTQPARELVVESSALGELSVARLGLPLFTLALGLLDGFNPCAMWVLLFLLALLVNLHSRARMALIAGVFVLVSGAVYFAFMAAWLNVFLLIGVSRPVQLSLGGVAMLIGAVNVKDFLAFRRGVTLSIPEAAKPGIYARVRAIVRAERVGTALVGATVLAVLVNLVELLCTAGFPAVYTHVLAAQSLSSARHYGYLALYNAAYIADDALVVAIAVATLGGRRLDERQGRWLKLLGGAVMLALGALLVLRPDWLR